MGRHRKLIEDMGTVDYKAYSPTAGAWVARPYDPILKRRPKAKSFMGEADAYAWLREQQRAIAEQHRTGKIVDASIRYTFHEWGDKWIAGLGNLGPQTLKAYAVAKKVADKHLGREPVQTIDSRMVSEFVENVLPTCGGWGYQVKILFIVRSVLGHAQLHGLRFDNPAAAIKMRGRRKVRPQRRITPQEFRIIVKEMPEQLAIAVLLGRYAGLRIGEVCGMTGRNVGELKQDDAGWSAIDVDRIRLNTGEYQEYTKSGKGGTVAIPPVLVDALYAHRSEYGWTDGPIMESPHKRGEPVSNSHVDLAWRRAARKACPNDPPRFHDLRHAFAQEIADEGGDAMLIAGQLRHSDLSTVQVYVDRASAMTVAQRRAQAQQRIADQLG